MLSDSVEIKEKSLKVYDIKENAEKLNYEILKHLLVIHSTLPIYDKGKSYVLKLVTKL